MIIIPIKWLFHWEYTLFSDKPEYHPGNTGLSFFWGVTVFLAKNKKQSASRYTQCFAISTLAFERGVDFEKKTHHIIKGG